MTSAGPNVPPPPTASQRKPLLLFLLLLLPVAFLAMRYDRYIVDGDAVAYMDLADLLHAHHWAGAVNAYWHPLYPALLWLGQVVFHPSRNGELGAYYSVNYGIFFLEIAAMLWFTTALCGLRSATCQHALEREPAAPLLGLNAMRLLGVGLVVISAGRELSMGRVRPDALLEALILGGMAALLQSLTAARVRSGLLAGLGSAAAMGVCFGLAYLTKSFAFLLSLLAVAALVLLGAATRRANLRHAVVLGAVALGCFGVVAGPYMAALSHQKHRFDFGDSGSLNYAWYVSGTEKMHLEPSMTGSFGAASVHLAHPERQLAASPGVYSYRALPYGTYPAWFDASFFNERIQPHFALGRLLRRDMRNAVLAVRYVFNHPEAPVLLLVLLYTGARWRMRRAEPADSAAQRRSWWQAAAASFWLPPVALGTAMWAIYGMVNVEERYVTVAWLVCLLPVFAALKAPDRAPDRAPVRARLEPVVAAPVAPAQTAAALLVVLLAFLALGDMLRNALETRRAEAVSGYAHGWDNPQIFGAAQGLAALGVKPGDEIACIGVTACLNDMYWARLAGVRILTEVYAPEPGHLTSQLAALPDRQHTYDVVKAEGARVLVGSFDPGEMTAANPAAAGWQRLGETDFYALPLNLSAAPQSPAAGTAKGAS